MRRIRTIKPEFFQDEKVAEVSLAARLLFVALWTMADREGRLEDRPRVIKLGAFPWDDGVEVETVLQELAGVGFIERYSADGKPYIQIRNFAKHQRPNHREAPSNIPSPAYPGTPGKARGEGKGKEAWGREGNVSRARPGKPGHAQEPDPELSKTNPLVPQGATREGFLAAGEAARAQAEDAEKAGDSRRAVAFREEADRMERLAQAVTKR